MKNYCFPALLALLLLSLAPLSEAQEKYGPVRRGQDLWDIAAQVAYQHYQDADVSHTQVMLALVAANPEAFTAPCNANSPLRVGVLLTIPAVAQVLTLSKEQAQQQFDQQLQQWEAARLSGKPLVCPPVTATPTAAVTTAAAPASKEAPPITHEAAPIAEETPAIKETPAAREAPAVREAPAARAAPAGKAAPAAVNEPAMVTPPVEKPVEKPESEDWLFERKHRVELEGVAVAVFGALLLGMLFWRFRRKPVVAAAAAVAPPGEDFGKLSVADTLSKLQADEAQGLTAVEAGKRLQDYGPNALEEKKVTLLQQLLPFFWGPIPWMIEAAALLSLLTQDWRDFTIIMVLLLFNAALGFHESRSAANALAALKGQLALKARARRDGHWQEVAAATLVPGDIIRIRLGDVIPADAKLVEGEYLTIDQAALTGESLPVNKKLGELAFSGSVAKQGEMVAVVTGTGANTFFGRTAQLVESAGAKSHLQEAVLQVGNFLILTAMLLCALLTAVELYWGASFLKVLKMVLILVVASIPVAMPAVLSVTLALGALALSKLKAIVSRLEAIEEMAGVDILCSDKTGTLTKNQLTLGEAKPFGNTTDQDLILAGALASKAENNDTIDLAVIAGLQDASALNAYTRTQFTPFDPIGKRTEAAVQDATGNTFKISKGAPQVILQLCEADQATQQQAEQIVDTFAAKGFRTLGVGRTDANGHWQFLGILPLYDPPRDDSATTIAEAKRYGIRVKMVTGDNTAIAREIAGQLGIGTNIQPAEALFAPTTTGELPPAAAQRIEQVDGFAQVFPEHKYHIVKALQTRGHLVAMTGDGVNDAPGLKQADIGVAVSGATDAARAAAALVLTAPGLSVITRAVEEARRIFKRLMTYVTYRTAMSLNIMVFVVLASLVYGIFPLTAIMLVILALLNDVPIMTIAYDQAEVELQPLRWNRHQVFTVAGVLGVLSIAESFGLLVLGMEYWQLDSAHLRSMMFLQLVSSAQLLLLVNRSRKPFWFPPLPSWPLALAIVATQILGVLMAGFGWLIPALPWWLIGAVWAYNLIWLVGLDLVKLALYWLMAGREARGVFADHLQAHLRHVNQPVQAMPEVAG